MNLLKTRYLTVIIIFIMLYLLGILVLNTNMVNDSLLKKENDNFIEIAHNIGSQYSKSVSDIQDHDQWQAWLKTVEIGQPFTALIADDTGQITTSYTKQFYDVNKSISDVLQNSFTGIAGTEEIYNEEEQILELHACLPLINTDDSTQFSFCLSQPSFINQHKAEQIIDNFKRIWTISISLSAIITFVLLFFTLSPIRKITESLDNIPVESDYRNLQTRRHDEIGELVWSINKLMAHFNQKTNDLQFETVKRNSILKYMSDGMIIVNQDDIVEEINLEAQRIFDIQEDEAIGLTLVEVVRHHKLIELHQASKNSRKQESRTFETIPNKLFLRGVASPLQAPLEGYTLLVIQDLTRLRHLEMVRKDFVSNVSHELRTPIASIKALTETLSEGAIDDPQDARRFLTMMENEIDNINQMVQELLELSRIEAGKAILDRISIDANELASKAHERMLIQAERANINLVCDCSQNLPPVYADQNKIGQVFINLIHNAIKFSSPGDTITLSTRQNGNKIVFSVKDEGIGIDPQNIHRIFERFYKEDVARSGQGTGLGLAIAKHIIESHGGKIWAENRSPRGSVFSFTLPIM